MKYLSFLLLLVLPAPVFAQESAVGWQYYLAGEFDTARSMARTSGTPEGYALACRAGMVAGGFLETGRAAAVRSLHQALKDCEQALIADPNSYVAGLSHAIAIGFEGLRLRKASYARASRREIEALIDKYPDNALATGALAGWHAAVAREGWLARLFLRASRSDAKTLYRQAMDMPDAELPLYYEYIRFLAEGDKAERLEAIGLIQSAINKGANDGLGRLLLTRCQNLLKALESGKNRQIQEAIDKATPFIEIDEWGTREKTDVSAYPLREALR